jgi:hypothetical protein
MDIGTIGTSKNKLEQLELERSVIYESSKQLIYNEIRHFKALCP